MTDFFFAYHLGLEPGVARNSYLDLWNHQYHQYLTCLMVKTIIFFAIERVPSRRCHRSGQIAIGLGAATAGGRRRVGHG